MPYCNALFYRRYDGGAGASSHPTILLHGLGGSHLSWPPEMRRLRGHHIFALDLPGHGHASNGTCVDMECHTQALRKFVQNMRFDQVNLVGHSMGAMIAYAFASQFPSVIHSLSLMSIGEKYPFARQLELNFIREKTRAKAIGVFHNNGFHADFPKHTRTKLLAPLHRTRLSLLHADAMVCANFYPQQFPLTTNRYPVLIITGKDDNLVPISGVRYFAASIPGSQLEIIKDCGHFVIYEQPKVVSYHLQNFLDQNR